VGLDAVWDFIKRLKGEIRMDSEKSKGSTFFMQIPLENSVPV
jgi:chemotaxis protein histidine kinase CheA